MPGVQNRILDLLPLEDNCWGTATAVENCVERGASEAVKESSKRKRSEHMFMGNWAAMSEPTLGEVIGAKD